MWPVRVVGVHYTREPMSHRSRVRTIALLTCVVALVLGMASAALAEGVVAVTPNFDGSTRQAGSTLNISWTGDLTAAEVQAGGS